MTLADLKWAVAELARAATGRSSIQCGCEACDRPPDRAKELDGAVAGGFSCTAATGIEAAASDHSAASAYLTGS